MSRLGTLYAVVALALLLGGAAIVVNVYDSGSGAAPRWMDAVRPGALSTAHSFLDSQCEACHKPQRGITAASCVLCHASNETLLARQSTTFHATIGDCRGCHVEHQGPKRPVSMDHQILAALGGALSVPAMPSTASLSDRVLSSLRRLAATPPRRAEDSLDCFSCHSNRNPHHDGSPAASGAAASGSVGSLFGRECAACHTAQSWKIDAYKHPSPRSTECAQCHQAPPSHFMMHFEMVSKRVAGQEHARVEQCVLCHQTDAWNSIKGVGWYKHH